MLNQKLKCLPLALLCSGLGFGYTMTCAAKYAATAAPVHAVSAADSAAASAQALAPSTVLATMGKVAAWQLANPTAYPLDDWTEGVGDLGFMALSSVLPISNAAKRCARR